MSKCKFALVCYRDDGVKITAEWTYWSSRAQAEQARDRLTPCGPRCIGVHAIAAVSRQIATVTINPASGNSAPLFRKPAPPLRNVI